jgi:uncharacterized phage protein (TIGR02218 family)
MKSAVADARFRVICLRIVPKIGSTIYLTHHVRDLVMSGHTYLSSSGYDFTGYTSTASMSPSMIDLKGIAGLAGIGFDEIGSGVFDNARAYLFATTWNSPVEDEEPIVASILGKTTLQDSRYTIEEMALIDALNQSVGNTYTAACPKTFGGTEYGGCNANMASPVTRTGVAVTSVTSRSIVTASSLVDAADYYGAGTIQFTSGANNGLKPLEIKSFASGVIETFEPHYYLPNVTDQFTIIAGCRKRLEDCRDKFNNVVNAGFFLNIPLSSQYSQVGQR